MRSRRTRSALPTIDPAPIRPGSGGREGNGADWIKTFVTRPDKDLGRAGPVRPFVPVALDRKTLWLASEHVANGGLPQVAELMNGCKRRLLEAEPADGDEVTTT